MYPSLQKWQLEFEFLPPDTVSFVPMDFGGVDRTIPQTYQRNPFGFSPATFAVVLTQARQFMDGMSNRNRFDVGDFSDDFKVHYISL